MRALILAAGRGTRISRYLNGKPKCTVDIGGITLIENTVIQLKKAGITDIAICLGYKQQDIKSILKEHDVKYYYNPFFDISNSIASTWFAKDFIQDDIIIMNGDVFLEEQLLQDIIKESMSPVLFCDVTRKEEADYKFYFEDNLLIKYGKELEGEDVSGEYIGVAKISKDNVDLFKESLDKLINSQNHGLWWENALYCLSDKMNIYVKSIEDRFWAEVDYIEDYERILAFRDYKVIYNMKIEQKE
ncbi:phosphocholine cytidylyltransferase family protein [Clostridium fungisolvens]|uniref:CTP:phosphoglutamine cytidylyltransferase n=1 Tax=Clostridium fungisolvens TaxID=1604897 RepID=A0A6V8SCR7_9CLOT|nr:phosphocholine cytidylyltransferase family protein [Clostridium fungisolvens]GFP74255.1 CTP:phosphoglutamine cytidylyltransferase [Clostridium fungisolvens]